MLGVKQGVIKYHFCVFCMTRPRIEPRSSGPLANALTTMGISGKFLVYKSIFTVLSFPSSFPSILRIVPMTLTTIRIVVRWNIVSYPRCFIWMEVSPHCRGQKQSILTPLDRGHKWLVYFQISYTYISYKVQNKGKSKLDKKWHLPWKFRF